MENSIYYFTVIIGTAIFCLCVVLFLKKPFYKLSVSSVKQLNIILDSILPEKEKDKLILSNLVTVLSNLFVSLFLLFGFMAIGSLPVFILHTIKPEINIDISSIYFYGSMIIGSFSLFLIQKQKNSDYSYWSKLLHTIILDNYNLGIFLFKREVKKQTKKELKEKPEPPFVIVTGLARAGTTALTKLLYDPQLFHSINYANMPFLMAPNLWRKFYNPKHAKLRERAHGDKVFFSENSIEALEEYFYKALLNDDFIKDDFLQKHEINEEIFAKYLQYQKLFKSDSSRNTVYLAKNNNFILRYESIQKINQNFKTLFVYRNPLDHAKSLLAQHENFVSQQSDDKFVLQYMNWLGHYEFGLNQKYFDFDQEKIWLNYSKESINYWIAIWINYYSYLLKLLNNENLFLVHYYDLAQTPSELINKIGTKINVPLHCEPKEPFIGKKSNIENLGDMDNHLLEKANVIYKELIANDKNIVTEKLNHSAKSASC